MSSGEFFPFMVCKKKHVLKKVIWCFLLNFPRSLSITVSVYFQNRFSEKWCVITFILRVFEGYCFQKWMLFCRSKQIEQRYAYDKNILKRFTSNRNIMWYPKKKLILICLSHISQNFVFADINFWHLIGPILNKIRLIASKIGSTLDTGKNRIIW